MEEGKAKRMRRAGERRKRRVNGGRRGGKRGGQVGKETAKGENVGGMAESPREREKESERERERKKGVPSGSLGRGKRKRREYRKGGFGGKTDKRALQDIARRRRGLVRRVGPRAFPRFRESRISRASPLREVSLLSLLLSVQHAPFPPPAPFPLPPPSARGETSSRWPYNVECA